VLNQSINQLGEARRPQPEAQRQQDPPHQLEGLGSAAGSPGGLWCGAQAAQRFSYILNALDGFTCYIMEYFMHMVQPASGGYRQIDLHVGIDPLYPGSDGYGKDLFMASLRLLLFEMFF